MRGVVRQAHHRSFWKWEKGFLRKRGGQLIKRITTNPFDPSAVLRTGQAQDRVGGFFNFNRWLSLVLPSFNRWLSLVCLVSLVLPSVRCFEKHLISTYFVFGIV